MSESINNPGENGETTEVHTVEQIQALRAQAEREAAVNGNNLMNEVSGAMRHANEQKLLAQDAAREKMRIAYEANPNKIGDAPAWPEKPEVAAPAPKPVIDVPKWTQQ